MKYIDGCFLEGKVVTVEIDGKQIRRKVKHNRVDGLYIIYHNQKYFESECDYELLYKQRMEENKNE